jgi:hypothetical protein
MNNPNFNVDRRSCLHIGIAVAGFGDSAWSSQTNYSHKTVNPATGLYHTGVTAYQNIGFMMTIRHMQYNYERGIRRFLINSPCGNVSVGPGIPAYGGIWNAAKAKEIVNPYTGVHYANPNNNCWGTANGSATPVYSTNPADPYTTTTFTNDGRTAEFYVLLRTWLISSAAYGFHVGLNGVTPMTDKRDEVEIIIYTGFGIPYQNNVLASDVNYVRVMGEDTNYLYQDNPSGAAFQMPDPDNNPDHATYLEQWKQWHECGVSGIGADVGAYAWNWRNGCWAYTTPDTYMPATHGTPKTDIRKYLEKQYNDMAYGFALGERMTDRPFSYFAEGHPWDWNVKNAGGNPAYSYPIPGTEESLSLLSPLGDKFGLTSPYSGSWQHYCKYIQMHVGLSQFTNGAFPGGVGFAGADPNRKWKFDKANTEIHLYVTNPAQPWFDTADANMYSMETTYEDFRSQINDCVDWWTDYIDRGYCFQPINYHDSYKVNKEIVKGVLQYTGEWPDSDPDS